MWMMGDLNYTDAMVQPIKKMNLDDLEEPGLVAEVIFAPLHFDDYMIKGNKLVINFFKINTENGSVFIDEKELKIFIKEKLTEH